MVGRGELTGAAWAELAPLLPRHGRRGQPWRGHRTVLDGIRVPRPGGRGRPRKRPDRLIGDQGYSYQRCRRLLRRRGMRHVIPERDDQRARRATAPDRKPAFDREPYRRRTVVERCVNRLEPWRGIATRFEKRAANYRAMVVIAALMLWLGS